jgi:hypothetical protein
MVIWKGSFWISANANIYSHSGIEQLTDKYNNLTVGGTGQSHQSGMRIVSTPQVSDALVAIRGQAAEGYFPPGSRVRQTSLVSDYLRTVAYLPPQDAFVIVDRVTVRDSSQTKVFRWHSKNPATLAGNTFALTNPAGDQRCVGTVLTPATLGSQVFKLGNDTSAVSSNAVTVTLPTGRASDQTVTVIQCSTVAPVSLVTTASGVTVTVGAVQITLPTDPAQAVTRVP